MWSRVPNPSVPAVGIGWKSWLPPGRLSSPAGALHRGSRIGFGGSESYVSVNHEEHKEHEEHKGTRRDRTIPINLGRSLN